MLILSRRATETLRFPQLGISVSIISVKGSRVQVGIDAPPEIRVIRHELEEQSNVSAAPSVSRGKAVGLSSTSRAAANQANHRFRNQLNKATLGLHLAQKQLAAGQVETASRTLTAALVRLAELESAANSASSSEPTTDPSKVVNSDCSQSSAPTLTEIAKEGNANPIHVLLVEDDPNEQALLKGLLEMEGYQVHTASNGHEAIARLRCIQPKFVLLDMMMPECDGRETLLRIREMPAFEHLPIFAVSGSSPDSVGLSIGRDGVEDWFPKPLNAPRLVQHMRDKVASLST